ncbi:hypothetical protein RBB50_010362 [Rhinocladiella similis]
MSDTGRKPLSDRVGETITPDSQKTYADQAKETATGTLDNIAGMVQPGDSKSTSQKLSDEASSKTGSTQDTASNLTQKASSTAGSTFENVQTKAADLGGQISDNTAAAQKNIQETASNITQQAQDDGTAAQDTGKSYLGQAQELAANALNSASKAASDLANTITGEKK